MAKPSSSQPDIVAQIIKRIESNHSKKQAALLTAFAKIFFRDVFWEDLYSRGVENLYKALLAHWQLLESRKPKKATVEVFNPDPEKDGWSSNYTVIQIAQDDMPFLVDSTLLELARQQLTPHLLIHQGGLEIARDKEGHIVDFSVSKLDPHGVPSHPPSTPQKKYSVQACIYIEINHIAEKAALKQLADSIQKVLADVRCVVEGWRPMLDRVEEIAKELENLPAKVVTEDIEESVAFLRWIADNHFTFFGTRDYVIETKGKEKVVHAVPGTGLGMLMPDHAEPRPERQLSKLPKRAREFALSSYPLILTKTNYHATVHRSTYTDYIGVKRFDKNGNMIGERRFVGLYTSSVYHRSIRTIPFIRKKIQALLERAGFMPNGHAGKELLNILETLPRDELFQATENELYEIAMGVLHLQDRKAIRLFIRDDLFCRFYSCFIFVPRDRFNTALLQRFQEILLKALDGTETEYTTLLSESRLARIHMIVRTKPGKFASYDVASITDQLIEAARSWEDDLRSVLYEQYGQGEGNRLASRYGRAFDSGYREHFSPRAALSDIDQIETLIKGNESLGINFYKPKDDVEGRLRLKLFHERFPIPLSDVLPILENMGLRVIADSPHEVRPNQRESVWVHDFVVVHAQAKPVDVPLVKDIFQETFRHLWLGNAENDGFNRLVLEAGLNYREIVVLRAYAKYMQQIKFTFSLSFIADTLYIYPHIARLLIDWFNIRFSPKNRSEFERKQQEIHDAIQKSLDEVASLNEDRIIRRYIDVMQATVRTNFFQEDDNKQPKGYVSFKFDSELIPEMPLPRPRYEAYVYSQRVEGVHLRSAKVARGGLRWSDRHEDFRTEVLGLMKAQKVKNSVIVPQGAKGGFITKQLPTNGKRETIMEEVQSCYRTFIRGLLDITDNRSDDSIVPPANVVRYDDDDPYLVVAADKGTATFSDLANAISEEYGFWLGDAFASGGSVGYDHKKMGITARGGWVSVERHFRELGMNIRENDFTVVGIGDMSGDVFGNGLLLSKHIKLVAAFNHMHIFLDPNPNPAASYEERKRLFRLPRSTWEDYDAKLISSGGGIYKRSAKSIPLSEPVKNLLSIDKDAVSPHELIRAILSAEVDLLWNGGIGTYVKSSVETNLSVGDKTNDDVRVDGRALRCKVVGEGGNLGFTQLGRVEYALRGGRIYTDFIDNSGGVDCSDHEVNIKILLNGVVTSKELTMDNRNKLLAEMTDEVAQLSLKDNYRQAQAISIAMHQVLDNIDLNRRYVSYLSKQGFIDRELEFLPSSAEINARKAENIGLTPPEIAVLLAYSKNILSEALLQSELPNDPYLSHFLQKAFPRILHQRYPHHMDKHQLRREIIVNQLVNMMINFMGYTFTYRLQEETGASLENITCAFLIACETFLMEQLWEKVESLDFKVRAETQMRIMVDMHRLVRRATRWFVRNRADSLDIKTTVAFFQPKVFELGRHLPNFLVGEQKEHYESLRAQYLSEGMPPSLAKTLAGAGYLFSVLDIVDESHEKNMPIEDIAVVYFGISQRLDLAWLREKISTQPTRTDWDALDRVMMLDDLDLQQCAVAASILTIPHDKTQILKSIDIWFERHANLLQRWQEMIANLRGLAAYDFPMFSVALWELSYMAKQTVVNSDK